jgi:hypothetical protein
VGSSQHLFIINCFEASISHPRNDNDRKETMEQRWEEFLEGNLQMRVFAFEET